MKKNILVLIIEDDPAVRNLLGNAVSRFFPESSAIECSSFAHAREIIIKGAQIDIVLTDMDLLDGREGGSIVNLAKLTKPERPVIVISGDLTETERKTLKADAFFDKPLKNIMDLKAAMERLIEASQFPADPPDFRIP